MTRLSPRLRWPAVRFARPTLGDTAVAMLAAFALTAHAHELVSFPPTRKLTWWLTLLGLAALTLPAARVLVARGLPLLRATGWPTVVLPLAVGVFLPVWWAGRTTDLLWVHRGLAGPLRLLLPVAEAVTVAAVAAGLLSALIATDPPDVPRTNTGGRPGLVIGLFAVAAVGFAGWYVGQESTVYASDSMYYWTRTADWAAECVRSPAAGWDSFRRSVQQPGYTLLPAVVPGAAMAALGDHRAVYVAAVAGVYLGGLAAAAGWFARALGGRWAFAVPAVLLVTMPMAWAPVVRGYPDAGGAALAVLAAGLYLSRPRAELRWPQLLGAAAALAGMALFRRWYSFFAVAFLVMVALDAAVGAVRPLLARNWKDVIREARPAVAVGGLFALLLVAAAWPMVRLTAAADYADAYAGYKSPVSWWHRTEAVARGIGLGYWAVSGVSLFALMFSPNTRRAALVLAGTVPLVLLLFMRVQDLNGHHTYLLLPALLMLPTLALARLPTVWPTLTIGGLAALAAAPVLLPEAEPLRPLFTPFGSNARYHPIVRTDRAEFERLLDTLEADGGRFYCLASSADLHYSVFQSAERSLRRPFPAADRLEPTAEVDRVHGFPTGLFRAELVLVADPPQLHLPPAEQQTVAVPHRHFAAGTGIARAFDERPGRFPLQNGVTVRLFRRARPIDPADFAAFCEELRAAHPDRPFVFRPAGEPADLLRMPTR